MGFTVTAVREAPLVRYEKVGRLIPGDTDVIRMMLDGTGEIGVIPVTDLLLLFGGIAPDGVAMSESGNRVFHRLNFDFSNSPFRKELMSDFFGCILMKSGICCFPTHSSLQKLLIHLIQSIEVMNERYERICIHSG
jgi:hypothetical protein